MKKYAEAVVADQRDVARYEQLAFRQLQALGGGGRL